MSLRDAEDLLAARGVARCTRVLPTMLDADLFAVFVFFDNPEHQNVWGKAKCDVDVAQHGNSQRKQ